MRLKLDKEKMKKWVEIFLIKAIKLRLSKE